MLQEVDLLQKASQCIEYIQEALQNRDYETMKIEVSELNFLAKQLQEIEMKKARRAQLTAIVQDMRRRGIKIDFVSQMIKKEKSSL
ncbi:hypothetical protein B6A27_00225 [Anoxybacillus sp. UARK-01]|uniref:hypothetical protein n=1 Tax=Anoxybacillus sp. UARK-01 TaxID=1895648 RepID=UPI0009B9A46A|nr:hypothetical protein [Anoxybacillus sp. UARK-01]OQM47507.1 hypothetical protein B6A27_00225 [Anoxybacillus sp. UARK-01]